MKNLNDLSREVHKDNVDRGFWSKGNRPCISRSMMLIVTELAEIVEEDRKGSLFAVSDKVRAISRFEEELADVIIRALDVAGAYKLDIQTAIDFKLRYNKSRINRHGKRY